MTYYGQGNTDHNPEWKGPQKVESVLSANSACTQVWSSLADLADFPKAGNVITIDQSGVFCVPGILDLQGNRLQFNAGSEIEVQGNSPATSEIRSTGLPSNETLITTAAGSDTVFEQLHLRHSFGGVCLQATSNVNETVECFRVRFSGEIGVVNSGIAVNPSGGSVILRECELKNLAKAVDTNSPMDMVLLENCDIKQCTEVVRINNVVKSIQMLGCDVRQCTTAFIFVAGVGELTSHTSAYNTFDQCSQVYVMPSVGGQVTGATVDGNQYRQIASIYNGAGFNSTNPEETPGWVMTVPCIDQAGVLQRTTALYQENTAATFVTFNPPANPAWLTTLFVEIAEAMGTANPPSTMIPELFFSKGARLVSLELNCVIKLLTNWTTTNIQVALEVSFDNAVNWVSIADVHYDVAANTGGGAEGTFTCHIVSANTLLSGLAGYVEGGPVIGRATIAQSTTGSTDESAYIVSIQDTGLEPGCSLKIREQIAS